ncbi:MAG: chromophore lyase CpcT/CpeT [Cyanobacteria bacterium P01_D01_bin.1]
MSPLLSLAHCLAGEFENQHQAKTEPAWYVHLRLWQRPIPSLSSARTFTFLLEQQNVISGQPPYRQRILQIKESIGSGQQEGQLEGQYFALRDPLKFKGAGQDPSLLSGISQRDLVTLPNSGAMIRYQRTETGYQFQSALKDGELCSFEYGGQTRYVYLGFDIEAPAGTVLLKTYDKGIDPDTGRGLWGALMGPFLMVKQVSFEL